VGTDLRRLSVTVAPMTRAHLDAASEVHRDAFRDHMNGRLGARYARALLAWFMAADRGIALVAIGEDDRVVGYVAGAPVGYGPSLTRALLPVAAASAVLRPWLLFDRDIRARIVTRLRGLRAAAGGSVVPEEPDTMSLVAIGVASSARGQQVGAALLRAFEERASALGMRAVRLSVYDHNVPARRLYERAGWSVVKIEGQAIYFGRRLA
jgi:ribosomal protein S18 acetylase RimI-like enzyme